MDRPALLARGAAAAAAHRFVEAEAAYRGLLDHDPRDADALGNLGAVLNATGRHGAAERACRAALAVDVASWGAWANLGTALHQRQCYPEAVAAYAASLRLNPGNPAACTNLGVALVAQGHLAEALAIHEVAAALAPDDAEIRCNHALARLAAGDLVGGFALNEARWQAPGMAPHGMDAPAWDGADPAGRTILLHDEGGFGDTLQFVRYAPLLAARGAQVVLRVQPPLVRLLRRLPGVGAIVARGAALPRHDLHCPMLSLPHRFGTSLDSVPAAAPYLAADPEQVARWRDRLPAGTLRVGLVWAGAARPDMPLAHAMDRRRSLPLPALAPLAAAASVRFVSLQLGPAAAETPPAGLDLFDPTAALADFDDTAALVAALDLVISVDTAVAHLAAGLGRPVWLLNRYDSCWRWLAGRADSPWYPTMRLYRQPAPGDWQAVVREVARDLQAVVKPRRAVRP